MDKLGPPEYAAMVTIFTLLIIVINWNFYQSLRPSTKFGKLESVIHVHRVHCEDWVYEGIKYTELLEQRKSLIMFLNNLGINSPELNDPEETWISYLSELRPLSIHKKIRDARKIYQHD